MPLAIGTALAVAALAYVLSPLFAPRARGPAEGARPDDDALEAMVARHRAAPRACPACDAPAAPDAEFCTECGARI